MKDAQESFEKKKGFGNLLNKENHEEKETIETKPRFKLFDVGSEDFKKPKFKMCSLSIKQDYVKEIDIYGKKLGKSRSEIVDMILFDVFENNCNNLIKKA